MKKHIRLTKPEIIVTSTDKLTSLQQLIVRMRRGEGGEGLDIETIAMELGITVSEVREALLLAGLDHKPDDPGHKYGLPQATFKAIVADYTAGRPIRDIGEQYRVSSHKIYDILAGEDIPLRTYVLPHSDQADRRDEEVIEAYAPLQPDGTRDSTKGLPLKDIRAMTGVSQMTIHSIIHANGIPLRQPKRRRRSRSMIELIQQADVMENPETGAVQLALPFSGEEPVPDQPILHATPTPTFEPGEPTVNLEEWTPWKQE